MSTVSHPRKPGPANGPRGHRLWCRGCDTDEHLVIESVRALEPPMAVLVETEYTCIECASFYSHPATVAQVGAVLNRSGPGFGVLQFGRTYLHCGEPMSTAGSERRSIYAPSFTEWTDEPPLDVYLRTKVLRCRCGFRMEIPD